MSTGDYLSEQLGLPTFSKKSSYSLIAETGPFGGTEKYSFPARSTTQLGPQQW